MLKEHLCNLPPQLYEVQVLTQVNVTKMWDFSSSGIKGVYQGVVPTILKQGSNQAIRFFVMESLKNWYREGDPKKPVPVYIVGAFGALAGACSVFGNTPIDVIKTRLQVKQYITNLSSYFIMLVP